MASGDACKVYKCSRGHIGYCIMRNICWVNIYQTRKRKYTEFERCLALLNYITAQLSQKLHVEFEKVDSDSWEVSSDMEEKRIYMISIEFNGFSFRATFEIVI
jgi:hypothetical protein